MANIVRRVFHATGSRLILRNVRGFGSAADQDILISPYEPVPPVSETLPDYIWQNLDKFADRTASVCALTGRGYTYAQIHKMSIAFAASLRLKLKIQAQDITFVALRNSPEYQIIFMGIIQAGSVASMTDPSNMTHSFKNQIEMTKPKVIITEKLFYPKIKAALNELKVDIPVILTDEEDLPEGTIKFSEFATDFNVDVNCLKYVYSNNKDTVCLPFSSGTTGLPKGVMISHYALVNLSHVTNHKDYIPVVGKYREYQNTVVAVLPFFHIYGLLTHIIYNMFYGSKLVTMPQFMPDVYLKTLTKYRPDAMLAVPPLVSFLGNNPLVTEEHIKSIKDVICGASALQECDFLAFKNKNKEVMLRQAYGLTETAGGISMVLKSDTAADKGDSVGTPVRGGEIKIVDLETQKTLEKGKEGEIWIKGAFLMSGYYNNEKATKDVLTDDGWFKTGDIGMIGDRYNFYVTGRIKELIKVKGFQVPPAELESIILTHPKVSDCAVVGIPDPITGEAPKAFVVCKGDKPPKKEEIIDFINSKVSSYKHVKCVDYLDQIPKNSAGKILRKELINL